MYRFYNQIWRISKLAACFFAFAFFGMLTTSGTAQETTEPCVRIEFFFSAGCDECRIVREELLPELLDLFHESIKIVPLDLDVDENYFRLAAYQEQLAAHGNDPVCVVLNGRVFLGGVPVIRDRLQAEVEQLVLNPEPYVEPVDAEQGLSAMEARLRSWSIWTIAGIGLVDGLNPCAFATLIFFMTLLISARQTKRRLLVVGSGFCLAVFLTYLALGFGAFHALRVVTSWKSATTCLHRIMFCFLLLMAFLSFRDAWRFRKYGHHSAVTLQLPVRIKNRIHSIMRSTITARSLFVAALGIGAAVTLLESLCTGQMYLPTLVYMAGHEELKTKAWALLLLYNAMFVAPQIIIFAAAYKGIGSKRMLDWSRKNVVPAKIMLGILFLVLALMLLGL